MNDRNLLSIKAQGKEKTSKTIEQRIPPAHHHFTNLPAR